MKFDITNLVKMANAMTDPKQAINLLLEKMEKTNPEKAKMLKSMYSSGKNPAVVIKESAEKGEISLKQLDDLKNYYALGRKFGLKMNIPKNVWIEAENAIKNAKPNNTFNGF